MASWCSFPWDPSRLLLFSSSLMKNWGSSLSAQRCYLHSFSNAPWMFSTFKDWVDTVMPVFTVWHIGVSGTKGNWGKDRNVFGKSFLFMFNFCLFSLQWMLSTAVKAKFVSAYRRPQRKYISQNLTPFHMGDVFVQFFHLPEGIRDLHTFCPLANINLIRICSTQAIILSLFWHLVNSIADFSTCHVSLAVSSKMAQANTLSGFTTTCSKKLLSCF